MEKSPINLNKTFLKIRHLIFDVQSADDQIDYVEISTIKEQIDESQHGSRADHTALQIRQPHHRPDQTH